MKSISNMLCSSVNQSIPLMARVGESFRGERMKMQSTKKDSKHSSRRRFPLSDLYLTTGGDLLAWLITASNRPVSSFAPTPDHFCRDLPHLSITRNGAFFPSYSLNCFGSSQTAPLYTESSGFSFGEEGE